MLMPALLAPVVNVSTGCVPRCRRREIPREANELSLDAGHGRHGP
jgi:hypothetical protein